MIDARGKALYALVTIQIELEEERFSDPLSEAMERFDMHMNMINNTTGWLYDKHGEVLMECQKEKTVGYVEKDMTFF